jgi:Family of unknown function (DUF5519)
MDLYGELFERLGELRGAVISDGAFGPGPAVWVGKREVAHVDRDGALDVRLTRSRISQRKAVLRGDPRVVLRRGSSDWLELCISTPEDLGFAVELVRQAVEANADSQPGPPPSGSELERRRRFH